LHQHGAQFGALWISQIDSAQQKELVHQLVLQTAGACRHDTPMTEIERQKLRPQVQIG
jgi:hypothetical protein